LENLRRDFVANVSHELRTPITAIQGFVETLRTGGIQENEKAGHFLDIISKQAERLNSIIEDLLALSRVEREVEDEAIELQQTELKVLMLGVLADCRHKAQGCNVAIELDCPDDLRARLNAHLMQQAVVNILDNAIKYSEPATQVELRAFRQEGEVVFQVRDYGCGIDPEHLPRIFERFYCVDKAHSRRLGGTGLGLAIVKHIARAHGGRVTVTSRVGEGSVFSIHIPAG